jgi:hypothetical protein
MHFFPCNNAAIHSHFLTFMSSSYLVTRGAIIHDILTSYEVGLVASDLV